MFEVFKKDESNTPQKLFTYNTAGAAFGELSLMYGKPRAASIKAKSAGKLWSIGVQAFRSVVMAKKQQGLLISITAIPLLNGLPFTLLQELCELSHEEVFDSAAAIGSAGSAAVSWGFCVLLLGQVKLKLQPDEEGKS